MAVEPDLAQRRQAFSRWIAAELAARPTLSKKDFADQAGVSRNTVDLWLSATYLPDPANWPGIARALELSVVVVREAVGLADNESLSQQFTAEEAGWVRILRVTHPGIRRALLEAARLAPPPRQDEGESAPPSDDLDPTAPQGKS